MYNFPTPDRQNLANRDLLTRTQDMHLVNTNLFSIQLHTVQSASMH